VTVTPHLTQNLGPIPTSMIGAARRYRARRQLGVPGRQTACAPEKMTQRRVQLWLAE